PEVELWLSKVYLKKNETDLALKRLSSITTNSDNNELRAEAFFEIGVIYFTSEQYSAAIENFSSCINETSDSETAGNAQYKLADSYFKLKQYENAVDNYDEVLDYDLPILIQFDAVIQMVNSLLELKQYDRAEEVLLNILRDQRFKEQYSMIATKLANMVEFQGEYDYAMEKYYEVIQKYPRTEGSALSSFYLAQLYEFEYGKLDSAKVKYDQVKKEYSKSESAEEAAERSKLLGEYLKIRTDLDKDKSDLYKLEHGDSSLVDSVVTSVDTLSAPVTAELFRNQVNENTNTGFDNDPFSDPDSTNNTFADTTVQQKLPDKKIKTTKVAVSRDPAKVEESFLKNTYRLAEYFLLDYQHYDSALVEYNFFVKNFHDSLLTPKAYYSLFYIYNDVENDSLIADSLKNLILTHYPKSTYAKQLSGKTVVVDKDDDEKIKIKFLDAEDLYTQKKYDDAIKKYNEIADHDSGTVWATKSRYAVGYIYENDLMEKNKAIESYSILAKEYPNTNQGKIAIKKIAEPPKEEPKPIEAPVDSTIDMNTLSLPDSSQQQSSGEE
ncbi:MAG: tetratricopeptide repeat protein, partial [Calditrichaeota bacterium]|nr:tetratricopeptide repeat protein [Calditrichota bacterium]